MWTPLCRVSWPHLWSRRRVAAPSSTGEWTPWCPAGPCPRTSSLPAGCPGTRTPSCHHGYEDKGKQFYFKTLQKNFFFRFSAQVIIQTLISSVFLRKCFKAWEITLCKRGFVFTLSLATEENTFCPDMQRVSPLKIFMQQSELRVGIWRVFLTPDISSALPEQHLFHSSFAICWFQEKLSYKSWKPGVIILMGRGRLKTKYRLRLLFYTFPFYARIQREGGSLIKSAKNVLSIKVCSKPETISSWWPNADQSCSRIQTAVTLSVKLSVPQKAEAAAAPR